LRDGKGSDEQRRDCRSGLRSYASVKHLQTFSDDATGYMEEKV
jgi:hypothetical protein